MEQLTGHPAFPLVVALWFAALIGLGSLVVPVAVIERIVVASGLPQVISAANPPLGTTARLAIAVLGAVAGAVLGLLIGRQAYRAGKARTHTVSPINAREELGEDGLDGPQAPVLRRRLITEAIEDEPEAEEPEAEAPVIDTPVTEDEDEALVLTSEAEDGEPGEEAAPAASEVDRHDGDDLQAEQDAAEQIELVAPQEQVPLSEAIARAEGPANEALADLSLMQLAQRLQGAIEKRRELRAASPAMTPAAIAPLDEPPVVDEAENAVEEAAQAATPHEEVAPASASPESETSEPDTPNVDEPRASAPSPIGLEIVHPATKPFVEADEMMANDEADEDETALTEGYTSLLAMTASVRAQTERPSEEAPAEAERSVRDLPARKADTYSSGASTLAALDRAGGNHGEASKPARNVDPQEQALRDALMNLSQFSS